MSNAIESRIEAGAASVKMISKGSVRAALDVADREFRECWRIVAAMAERRPDPKLGKALIEFQLRLFDAIAALEGIYRQIKQEEKRLVGQKSRLNRAWFTRRMAGLASYANTVKEALAIGRAIGDGFAWFFYQFDRDLIAEHMKHQRQLLLPPDIGRLGERLSLAHMQGIDGHLLIYHGTTTFLRMGDISLVDLSSMRVKSIGELKTQRVDAEHVSVSATFVAGSRNDLPKMNLKASAPRPPTPKQVSMTPAMRDRLDRQLKSLEAAIASAQVGISEKLDGGKTDFYYAALNDIAKRSHGRSFEFVQASEGLIIGAARLGGATSLGRALTMKDVNVERLFEGGQDWALKILRRGSKGNSLSLGSIGAGHDNLFVRAETLPFLMWPIEPEVLCDILFAKIIVITMFNPLHFMDALRSRGFEVFTDHKGAPVRAIRIDGNKRLELENLHYWVSLLQDELMTEVAVLAMIDQTLALTLKKAPASAIRVEIHPRIHRHRRPREGSRDAILRG